jgi:hypothetical protein
MARLRLFVFVALLLSTAGTGAHAQWLNYPTPGTPRTKDGKPDLAAPVPRTADHKPDLSGVWQVQPTSLAEWKRLFGDRIDAFNSPGSEIEYASKYIFNILMDFKPEEAPIRPEATEILRRRTPSNIPSSNCLPLGIPAAGLGGAPVRIVQSPRLIVMMYEVDDTHRQIYTDGRDLPREVAQPSWLGYSVRQMGTRHALG